MFLQEIIAFGICLCRVTLYRVINTSGGKTNALSSPGDWNSNYGPMKTVSKQKPGIHVFLLIPTVSSSGESTTTQNEEDYIV
jgi:hypothetical protein